MTIFVGKINDENVNVVGVADNANIANAGEDAIVTIDNDDDVDENASTSTCPISLESPPSAIIQTAASTNTPTTTSEPTTTSQSTPSTSTTSKRKKTKSKYIKSWETDPLLSGWLTENISTSTSASAAAANDYIAFCKVCAKPLKGSSRKVDLWWHMQSRRFIKKNAISVSIQPNAIEILQKSKIDKNVMRAQIQLSSFYR